MPLDLVSRRWDASIAAGRYGSAGSRLVAMAIHSLNGKGPFSTDEGMEGQGLHWGL